MKTYKEINEMIKNNEKYLKQTILTDEQINRAKAHIEALNWVIMLDMEFAFYGGEFKQ
jgi:hypothetical protein